jgi:hypothetical protein
MPIDSAWNAYIFRGGKNAICGTELARELAEGLIRFVSVSAGAQRTTLLDLLLRAGELECALADAGSSDAAIAAKTCDSLAAHLVGEVPAPADDLAHQVRAIAAPAEVHIAAPEGFAYYALHPMDYVDLVRRVPRGSKAAAIVGIRSIGTTLSAVVQAALHMDGGQAERITVRPDGHPYDRQTHFSDAQQSWLATMRKREADFLVVDEGPGMSGSSFLSVGEALVREGVPQARILLLCSRVPHAAALTAPDAAKRWPSFRAHSIESTHHLPARAKQYVAGGIWRAQAFKTEDEWPSSWLQMERLKFLSEDGSTLFRFEGFGRFGAQVHGRAMKIAEAGFGPMPETREEGFGVYRMLRGRYLSEADAKPAVLARVAEYCAFRAREFSVKAADIAELETMLRFNTKEEFGIDLPASVARLSVDRPVIADGRMLPHKWMECGGRLLKLDGATHGDDHFFPGPTDIAWDLAGTIVEWNLDSRAAEFFLEIYRQRSDDDVLRRLPAYLPAYAIFRTAYCKMAAAAMNGAPEQSRLRRDYLRYREQARALVGLTKTESASCAGMVA